VQFVSAENLTCLRHVLKFEDSRAAKTDHRAGGNLHPRQEFPDFGLPKLAARILL
jgi:hypothetical protein